MDRWEIIEVDREGISAVALARKIKILSHYYLDDADLSIWIDGSLEVVGDLNDLTGRFGKKDFVLFEHPRRNCVYQEFQACQLKKKADPKILEKQKKAYLEMKVPAGGGLAMTGLLMRRKSDQTRELNECWWKYTRDFKTWRDQLTLPLACWELNWKPDWELNWKPEILDHKLSKNYFRQVVFHKGIASGKNAN